MVVGRSPDSRRAGARILDTAEGVLVALRGCTLNQAFVEIVQTAKRHNVSTLSLANALVAMAQTQGVPNVDNAAFAAAHATWGDFLDQRPPRRPVRPALRQDNDTEHQDEQDQDEAASSA
jgi:flagellar biosynthesis component FlhA